MKRIEDERIINEKRRINSNAFGICFMALWCILLYRQFGLKQPINEYIDVFLLTIGLSIYITVNNMSKGLYLSYRNKKTQNKIKLLSALTGSIAFIVVQFFTVGYDMAKGKDILKLALSLLIFFLFWVGSQSLLLGISKRKANEDIDDE